MSHGTSVVKPTSSPGHCITPFCSNPLVSLPNLPSALLPTVCHCFIQRAPNPQEQKREKKRKSQGGGPPAKRGAVAGLQTLQTSKEEEGAENKDEPSRYRSMQTQDRHISSLVVAGSGFKGENCIRHFLEWLDTMTEDDKSMSLLITYGYFLVHEYHD